MAETVLVAIELFLKDDLCEILRDRFTFPIITSQSSNILDEFFRITLSRWIWSLSS